MYVRTYTHIILYKYIIYNSLHNLCDTYLANSRDTNHLCKIVFSLGNAVFCNFYDSRDSSRWNRALNIKPY